MYIFPIISVTCCISPLHLTDMENDMKKQIKRILIILILVPVISLAGSVSTAAAAPAVYLEEENDGGRELKITVVENIPADDIEDSAVPLAAPGSPAGPGLLGMMLITFMAVIVVFIAVTLFRRAKLRRIFAGYEKEIREEDGR